MSFQVNLNSVDISARIVSGPVVHKNDVLHGKISPNECSFDIDNTNLAYTIANLDIEGQLVEVWIDSETAIKVKLIGTYEYKEKWIKGVAMYEETLEFLEVTT